MKAFLLVAVIAVFAAIVAAEVHLLNNDNFEDFVKSQDYTLVKFFAHWCGHCKALAEPYKQAADKLAGQAKIAEVDCTEENSKALCEKYGVRGYPTLKGFSKDLSSVEYEEGRTADAVVGHVLAATSPAVTYIKSAADLATFKAGPMDLKLVINTVEDSEIAKAVESVAKTLRKACGIAIDTTNNDGKVTLLRNFDEPEVVLQGEVTGAALTKFVNENSLPVIGEIGPHNYKKYVDRNVPLVWIFIDYEDASQVTALDSLVPIAKEFNDKLAFAKLDGNKWAQHAKSFGLEKATPGIVIEDRTSRKKFAYPESSPLSATEFKAFLQGFEAKTLTPIFKSQPIPESNNGPVTVVVGKSFDSIVLDDSKDVFVKFYAEWCGHCKAMIPAYEALGEQFKDDANVVIAKFAAPENDQSAVEVQGFPTLYLFPAGSKGTPIRFNGDRTTEGMAEFINNNRKSSAAAAPKKSAHEEL